MLDSKQKIHFLPQCQSTNDEVWATLEQGLAGHGYFVYTGKQTAGRGQRGTVWNSNPGQNLLCSTLLRTQGLPITLFDLSRAASLAIVQAVIHWTAGKITPSLKWPNDIWVDGRKLGGILIENRWNGQGLEWSVIGLGLNVNQTVFAEGLAATSLKLLTGETLFVEEGAYTMQKELTHCLEKIKTVSALRMEYESLLVGFGQENYFTEPDGTAFMGRIIGTTPEGLLCIESKTGTRFFDIKEIQQGL